MDTVAVDRIDRTDRRFCISFPLDDPVLFNSISTFGIRMPLLLLDATPYLLVTGFKRLDSACRLGLAHVPCVITNMSERDAVVTALNDNIKRALNLVESALAIEKMSSVGFQVEEVYAAMKLLGFEPHEKLLLKLLEVARSDTATKEFLIRQRANMTHVELFFGFSSEERNDIIRLLSGIRLTASQLKEILQLFLLLRIKNGNILVDQQQSFETADALKLFLKKRTHPSLSALERDFQERLEKASLPPSVSIKVDPFFEREWLDICIKAHVLEDVGEAIRSMEGLIETGQLRSLFELTKGTRRN